MDNAGYTTLTRQVGLMREMNIVANNIANAATTGYRQEGLIFSEYVHASENGSSLSMARGSIRNTSQEHGALTRTNGQFDLAIEGDGFFLIEAPNGERLTRAGSFSPNAQGDLVNMDGHRLLDIGGAPVFVPPDSRDINIAGDGTLSSNGRPLTQIGIYQPVNPIGLKREDGVMFHAEDGVELTQGSRILQGFVEGSNVDPISQIARMIEVQRAYEMGQSFLESENERIRNALKALIR
ncbi:flagellar basal-body rod protein FlgF [Salinihabitans flavidus]|uniref:Flagellar basal-body rod protein FlgF n=1 Tax=Salinihabitans flavidus TaxID=569882 RepID=A0A1H8LQF1_9RHOB|nr:flagellar hook-basal body complex protein [Salinihabitans flavidus]SEO07310.1 flagellar basal-body rod protein FlgF [Salinihabitans flavidus]